MSKILVFPRQSFSDLVTGIRPTHPGVIDALLRNAQLMERTDELESNGNWLQPISYVVVWFDGKVLTYRRQGSEGRLHDLLSLGFGGHVEEKDWQDCDARYEYPSSVVTMAAIRELREELGISFSTIAKPTALIVDNDTPVGRVHLGILYQTSINQEQFDSIQTSCEMMDLTPRTLGELEGCEWVLEKWSQLVYQYIQGNRRVELHPQ